MSLFLAFGINRLLSYYKDGGTCNAPFAEVCEGFVCLFEGVSGHLSVDGEGACDFEKCFTIFAGKVGDGVKAPFSIEKLVGERGYICHVDAG